MKRGTGIFMTISITTVFAAASGQFSKTYGQCEDTRGNKGDCVFLEECNEVYNLFVDPIKRRENIQFLRASQCGALNRKILVCCTKKPEVELPSPARRECGRVFSDRILGGTETKLDEYPWMVLLEYKKYGKSIGHKCGGSLINKRYVLTAAHCVARTEPFKVRLGEWDIRTNPDCIVDTKNNQDCAAPHIDVGVEEIIIHPEYRLRSKNQYNDIALVRLEHDITFNLFIQPICMPPDTSDVMAEDTFTVAVWERTENNRSSPKKMKLEVDLVPHEDCQEVYKRKVNLISSQICAGGVKGQDSCSGDSGGPLMVFDRINRKSYAYLAGVVSFGPKPCGTEGWPGVYTKVSEFRDWILKNMNP